jgi:hypothetical protein
LIKNFQLRELFNQLGWNHTAKKEAVAVDSQVYQLEAIAEKSSFFVFVCETSGKVPDYAVRKKIDSAITKLYHQHLIIYTDNGKRQQVWQLVVKELDKPAVVRETPYFSTQEPELLFQKLQHLFFTIDEEDNITIADVTGRVGGAFNTNAEKVTKKFYEGFKKEHTAFLSFIKGITESQDKDWYASLMLNRLMFIYFIQKKGFLNNDKFYLKTKLAETQLLKGKDKFYSFYRNFLLVLFHQGLGSPDNKKLESELGKVPYLNGGLFDVHELESTYSDIQIDDKAFERIFSFFDEYEWHLDTRQQATGKEINPDVIGYIFEKYINDRAAMGAYYTKEDITDYIGKNCIIPFLFDELKRNYPAALKKGGEVWALLQKHAADYIYPAVQHGVELYLPPEIAKGLADVGKREEWNKTAPPEFGLPTEIWREVVERRRRYTEVKEKIEAGEIHEINDLITYNLNITRFAIDVIQNSSDPELIRHFYKALEKITVLDPTCGSGAFLFAALSILEPLYEACIGRMHAFVEECGAGKFKAFDDVLKRVDAPEHPNLQYFIFKSIILNNLYGVDIMHEAIEIAKLRLFLKLVACVDVELKKPNMGLEPLPDIDFNIRAGNTLVGFVSINEVKKAVEGQLGFHDKDIADIEEAAEYVKHSYDSFREVQIAGDATVKEFKKILTKKLAKLNDRLDVYLGKLYGKDPKKAADYRAWHDSHRPFHWFAEFYDIIHDRGGFDVIIGNPPYVEYNKVRGTYTLFNYLTEVCGNLYVYVLERSSNIVSSKGKMGFIVPIALISVSDTVIARKMLKDRFQNSWFSNYAIRPAKLFEGVEQRLTIWLTNADSASDRHTLTTKYQQWYKDERPTLFERLTYVDAVDVSDGNCIPKLGSDAAHETIRKLLRIKGCVIAEGLVKQSRSKLYFHRTPGYWIRMMDFEPFFRSPTATRSIHHIRELFVQNEQLAKFIGALISSSLYFFWFFSMGNCRNLTIEDVKQFQIGNPSPEILKRTGILFDKLMQDYQVNSVINTRGVTEFQEFNWGHAKPIIDQIDGVLAEHFMLSAEELDFISNYDIKIRMGKGTGDDEDVE